MPDDVAYDLEMLQKTSIRYSDFFDNGVEPPPAVVAARSIGGNPNPDSAPVPAAGGEHKPRRMKIQKADLEAYGYTAGCPGCRGAQDGVRRGRLTEESRRRIEGQLAERKEREKERIDQWMAAKAEAKEGETKEQVIEKPMNVDGETPKKEDPAGDAAKEPIVEKSPEGIILEDGRQ